MASTYLRRDSPFIWIRYKDAGGNWKSANSGYRQDNMGDRKQAEKLAQRKSLEAMVNKPVTAASHCWEAWVCPWMVARWGNRTSETSKRYSCYFWRWLKYFKEKQITQPAALRREHVINYLEWRKKHGGSRNTAIHEIKFLAQVMEEAVNRGYIDKNPVRKLGIKKDDPAEKVPWSDDEVAKVEKALVERDKFGWMHVTFLMGYHQAARLRQSQIPISRIDFKRRIIDYPSEKVKDGKGYSQPISPAFYPILQELVAHRQSLGKSMLCDLPAFGESIEWRRFLDKLGLKHLVHHGLRATWITQAALGGIPESLAKRFVNHASSQVHAIYQKITATDLMPMLDAFALYRRQQQAVLPSESAATA
jgi:integrase